MTERQREELGEIRRRLLEAVQAVDPSTVEQHPEMPPHLREALVDILADALVASYLREHQGPHLLPPLHCDTAI